MKVMIEVSEELKDMSLMEKRDNHIDGIHFRTKEKASLDRALQNLKNKLHFWAFRYAQDQPQGGHTSIKGQLSLFLHPLEEDKF